MSTKEINRLKEEISVPYLDLTTIEGLSIMEALCFSLVRVKGLSPMEASEVIKEMTGKEVSNFRVSVYVDRGRKKLLENDSMMTVGEISIERSGLHSPASLVRDPDHPLRTFTHGHPIQQFALVVPLYPYVPVQDMEHVEEQGSEIGSQQIDPW